VREREPVQQSGEPVDASDSRPPADAARGDRPARPRREEASDADEGRGQRRRRRGRRGGRGRSREGERAGDERGPETRRDDRDAAAGDDRPRRGLPAETRATDDDWSERRDADRPSRRDFGDGLADEPLAARSDEDGLPAPRRETEEEGTEDGERTRKRRRRGRRGGRGRGRTRTADEAAGGDRNEGSPVANDEHDDEPLPASYGSRPGATADERPRPAAAGRSEAGRSEAGGGRGEAGGEKRGRGRRRRRSGRDGAEPRRSGASGERREPASGRSTERRERRRRDDSRGSRGHRSDFAPVSGRYEEDDEGLEFLGVEEAARDPDARPRPPAEDDGVLAESGLTSVLDVPSWVEAIGIVIAGNLTARSRSGRGDGGKGR
jgi:ribonuclease E